jgi:hypothetical protein
LKDLQCKCANSGQYNSILPSPQELTLIASMNESINK